ncbi:dihydrofolate reductase family protein [Rhodococcus sp. NPDC003318]|uniref:dihydrofolate reductase family protein n=1 Tax=Rhodococcus sp. NPDC003318 TaxID=3364503 RepID=UPI0036AA9A42
MGRIVVSEFVSLDGVMEAPGGEPGYPHTGWTIPYHSADLVNDKLRETLDASVLLLGRRTYESFADAWPKRDGEFADKMNAMPKHVVTSAPDDLEWQNSTVLDGPVEKTVPRLRDSVDGDLLVVGSRTLVHALLRAGLVDELRLAVFPVVLGSGDRVFPESPEPIALELVDQRRFESGIAALTYRR